MDETPIKEVQQHKHLGITFQRNAKWSVHIAEITNKAKKKIDILRSLTYRLDRRSMEKLYLGYVRPSLEYSAITHDNCTKEEADAMENVQLSAARIVTGATKGTSHALLYKETRWETLKERRRKQKLKMMYKIIKKQAPSNLTSLIPERGMDRMRHNTRNRQNIIIPHATTSKYKDSFFPDTLRIWNMLPHEQRSLSTYEAFCTSLGKPDKIPERFYRGNRRSQILHTRIRLQCSPLKSHLYNKSIVESPNCECGEGSESAKHFLLECPRYNIERELLLDQLRELGFRAINTDLLLFGDDQVDETSNINLFTAVQNYITETERFTN
jgi:hypothetical protein